VRGLKSTIALLVVLIGLVAYIYFVDSKKPASDAPETKAKAFTVDADQIEEIQIKPTSGDASRVAKANGTWQLIEPEKAEADQGQVSNAATSLASLEINRVVDDNPSDLSQYGLNPPKAEITFRAKGQKDTHRLLLGEKTATGSDLYAKTPDQKRVFLISGYLENTFERTPFDLRDKAALKFDQSKADGIEIVHDGTTALAKSGSEWAVTKPYKARADFAGAEAVLTSLSSLQMQKIVENVPSTDSTSLTRQSPSTVAVRARRWRSERKRAIPSMRGICRGRLSSRLPRPLRATSKRTRVRCGARIYSMGGRSTPRAWN
jgi:hypothetical protein